MPNLVIGADVSFRARSRQRRRLNRFGQGQRNHTPAARHKSKRHIESKRCSDRPKDPASLRRRHLMRTPHLTRVRAREVHQPESTSQIRLFCAKATIFQKCLAPLAGGTPRRVISAATHALLKLDESLCGHRLGNDVMSLRNMGESSSCPRIIWLFFGVHDRPAIHAMNIHGAGVAMRVPTAVVFLLGLGLRPPPASRVAHMGNHCCAQHARHILDMGHAHAKADIPHHFPDHVRRDLGRAPCMAS